MAILKKQGKCANCGTTLPAGTQVSWKEVTLNHRHGGNGTVTRISTKWTPVHTSALQCKYGVNSHEEVVAIYQDRVEKLEKQAAVLAEEGDYEMTEFAYKSVRLAKEELAKL